MKTSGIGNTLTWMVAGCAALGLMTTACGDDKKSSSSSSSSQAGAGGGGGQGGSGQGAGDTGQCGGPGEACEATCTGMGTRGDCQECATMRCGSVLDACFADDTSPASCRDCSDFLLNDGDDEAELCGYDTGCGPGTSCALMLSVAECLCGSVGGP